MEIAVYPEVTYTATGTTTTYSFPFDYLRKAYVKVKIDDVATSDFSVSGKSVVFTTAPEADSKIYIYRSTSTTRLVSWADASVLKASNLTIQQVQELHILEEQQVWQQTAYDGTIKELQDIESRIGNIIPETTEIYNNTVAVYNSAVADTGAIKDDTQDIYDSAVTDTNAIKAATQAIKDATVSEVNTLKQQATATLTSAENYSQLAKKWAESDVSPDGLSSSKSSKTWANQIASYLDEAVAMKNYADALAAQVPVYSATTTYNIGDVVMTSDGATYRALTTVTGENPLESYKWAKVQTVDAYTFEQDTNGDVQVRLPATVSDQWIVDANGDIMIKAI